MPRSGSVRSIERCPTMSTNDPVTQPPQGPLPPGTRAPDFSLDSTPDQTVTLSDARGRPLILVFYPADWSPVCGDELALYNELLPEFHRFNAALAGISVDGPWCHIAFAHERKLKFPLLSDFEPHWPSRKWPSRAARASPTLKV